MELNKYIDHTLLKPDATREEILKLCAEAKENKFASVCVNPYYVSLCKETLKGSEVKVCTVIGFPLGQGNKISKFLEAYDAIQKGANELDMVMNIAALKAKDLDYVTSEIWTVNELCIKYHVVLKVIIETCLLSEEDKINACKCVSQARADYIKTSTGFSKAGATVEDVALLKKHIHKNIKVKAAGGIKTKEQALAMINAGASRIGTSHGVELVKKNS